MARTKEEVRAKTKEEARVKAEEEALAKTKGECWAKVEEEAARAKVEQEARTKAKEQARAKAEQAALVKAGEEARVKAGEEARAKVEDEIVNFQEFGKEQLEPAAMAATFVATSFRTIAAEATDYSKKSLENASAFVEKLLGAKSFESAVHIQSEYVKASYADFAAYLTKIGELYSKLGKEAFKRPSHVA